MTDKDYGMLNDVDSLKQFIGRVIDSGKTFGYDIESGYDGPPTDDLSTTVFHPRWKLVGFSFTDSTDWARYVPISHDTGENAPTVAAARLLWTLLQTGRGVAHNASFELQGLSRWFREILSDDAFFGEAVRKSCGLFPFLSDTLLEAHMTQRFQPLNAGRGVGVGLKTLTDVVFHHKMIQLQELFEEQGKSTGKASQIRFNVLELTERVVEYACEDAVWCLALHEKFYSDLKDTLIYRTEMALLPVLMEMEQEGLLLDWEEYEKQQATITHFKDALNEEIQSELSDRLNELVSVNFNSPQQVMALLYDKMGLPTQYNPKTKRPTSDDKALTFLAGKFNDPNLKKILEWRGVSKLLSAYITKYLDKLHYDPSGRARPNHNQLQGAGSGRFSVDGASYQQWPKPYHFELKNGETLDLNYRNFLVAPEGFRIVGFDFSQVELRILAGMANETVMLKAFADGIDIHRATASKMLNIPMEELTEKDRAKGKTLNFAIVYGQGVDALAKTLDISIEEAQELLEQYFDSFPKLRDWIKEREMEGQTTWEVSTLFGRRCHIWEYDDSEDLIRRASRLEGDDRKKMERFARIQRSKADRMTVNAPVQGGAADYMKIGMVRAQRAIKKAGLQDKIRLVMTVHDALEFYVHESVTTQEVIDLLNPCVSFPVEGLPEILAEWHEGRKWGEVVEVKLNKDKQITGYEWNKQHYDSVEAAYEIQDNPPVKEEVVEPGELVEVFMIELLEAPDAARWTELKDFIFDREKGDYSVYVKLGESSKSLDIAIKGNESEIEEMRFIFPEANFYLTTLDKELQEA